MKLITEVEIPSINFRINYSDNILMAGSCFAQNMGEKFLENKFNTTVNPFGVLYNPISVLQMLKYASGGDQPQEIDKIFHHGLWHSLAHHGSFSREHKEDLEIALKSAENSLKDSFEKSTLLVITWGTAWVYKYLQTDRIVANCHKIPSREFNRFRLTQAEIVQNYSSWLNDVFKQKPHLQVVFTVSPVRHLKDNAVGNQLSKSVLLLAAEELCNRFKNVHYFPSYEIVLDELRDYRFYAADMVHPNQLATDYIWEKLKDNWLANEATLIMPQIHKLVKAASHRPLKVETAEHQHFVKTTLHKIDALNSQFPGLDFSAERSALTKQLA